MQQKFIHAGVYTLAVLAIGLFLGFGLDSVRANAVANDLKQAALDTEELLLMESYIQTLDEGDCETQKQAIFTVAEKTQELGARLEGFGKAGIFKEEEFKFFVRKYYLSEVRYWLLLEGLKERCEDTLTTILFFFEPEDPESTKQGNVLTHLRETSPPQTIFVFSFNRGFENTALVDLLEKNYNVTRGPSLVVNGKTVYQGFTRQETLEAHLSS